MQTFVYLIVPTVAWIVSQLLKYLIHSIKLKSLKSYKYLYSSGDMPSSHAAMMVSLLATLGMRGGIATPIFGAVTVLTGIILYDAVNVRRAVGEQSLVLQKLQESMGKSDDFHVAKGHTLTEVLAGSILGLLVSGIVLRFL